MKLKQLSLGLVVRIDVTFVRTRRKKVPVTIEPAFWQEYLMI
jgi:hypothetical protein